MKFNTADPGAAERAFDELNKLVGKHAVVDIKKVNPKRTINQNSYLHLIIGAFAAHFGYEMEEAKQIYKEVNPMIYFYEKKGRKFTRSSADLNKEDMATSIDVFMRKSAEAGYELPPATDQKMIMELENALEMHDRYLKGGL